MVNKSLFSSSRGKTVKAADAKNAAGGKAYKMSSKGALARYAATGCISNTFYVNAKDHLGRIKTLAEDCDSEFIAKLAVFSRKEGMMKDMPALLLAILSNREDERSKKLLKNVFPMVIDNGKMLRNFIQIMRSGQTGRKSLGTGPRNLVRDFMRPKTPEEVKRIHPYWEDDRISSFLSNNHADWLFRQLSVGQNPSGNDIIKMIRPKGATPQHDALFAYIIGKIKEGDEKWENLPPLVKELEAWRKDKDSDPPSVDFQLLTSSKLNAKQWANIIRKGQWHFIRMNLNTAIRHGALQSDKKLAKFIAEKLTDKSVIRKARVMPYQLYAAYKYVNDDVPRVIVEALHDAMEISIGNVPTIKGNTVVIVDVSGSMGAPITGSGSSKASKIRCIDVASLFACAVVRNNRESKVLPVDTRMHPFKPEPRNTVITETARLSAYGGGGTNLSLALHEIVKARVKVDNVIVLSDQESWCDHTYSSYWSGNKGTAMMHEWETIRAKNSGARMVCIDIQPGVTHQTLEGRDDILHVSGWNDSVFKVVDGFLRGDMASWIDYIDKIGLAVE